MSWDQILQILREFGFPALTAFGAGWWIVQITKNHREDIANLTKSHREQVSQITAEYRQDVKQFYSDMERNLNRMMEDHAKEREEARKSWQHALEELKNKIELSKK
jgi:ElaB/YqjD/DUF883 family membrane-anchored ribosome-binding protein